jgi:hypothetical protein
MKAKLPFSKRLPKLLLFSDWNVPERVIKAWADDSQPVLIANAIADSESLIVSNCALEKIEVSFSEPVLSRIPIDQRTDFEKDEDGSFIRWPEMDIDLDFDSLRYLVDPELRKRVDADLTEIFLRCKFELIPNFFARDTTTSNASRLPMPFCIFRTGYLKSSECVPARTKTTMSGLPMFSL